MSGALLTEDIELVLFGNPLTIDEGVLDEKTLVLELLSTGS